MSCACRAEETEAQGNATADPSLNYTLDAAEADDDEPRRQFVSWNNYEGPYFTLRWGVNFMYDYVAYSQDDDSKEQMTLEPTGKMRDFRFILKGRFPRLPRLSYSLGYMYDAPAETWRFRQTGLMVDIPELWGQVFIGRTKEGFSTNRLMNGAYGWTMERAAMNDALLPILADGVKWMGNVPNGKFVYSLGWFGDTRSEDEAFNRNDNQFATRGVWLPFAGIDGKPLLHLALQARYGEADDGSLRFRSKPESSPTSTYAIDTGVLAAHHTTTVGVETYYRPGPLMFGMEYFFNQVASEENDDPFFHGGEIFAAYLLTGETRPYNMRGAYFESVKPSRTVFDGGPGAWELVLRYSYADLDSKSVRGGTFWRITPMVNWHLADNVRLEFVYGYGVLDRFDLQGGTHFFQTRFQFQL